MNENDRTDLDHPCHPGEVLRDWMAGHRQTIVATARMLGYSRVQLSRVLAGSHRMSAGMALALEDAGWSTGRFWLALQAQYDLALLRRKHADAA